MSEPRGNVGPDLFEQLPTPIHIYRVEGSEGSGAPRFIAANPAAVRLLGEGSEGSPLEEAFPALRGAGLPDLCARVARSGRAEPLGEIPSDGEKQGAPALAVKAFPMSEGRVGVMFEDTRAQKEEVAREVRRMHRVHSDILDQIPEIVFVKSVEDGRYVHWNKACAEVTGWAREDATGKTLQEIFPAKLAAHLEEVDSKVLAGREALSFTENIPGPRGLRTCRTVKTPIRDEDGRVRFLLGVSKDVTDLIETEHALQQSREELETTRTNLLDTIRELSTPVLPIHDGILVVPLVGHMDSQRSAQLTDALLSGIQRHRAETVIIDITGVELVDTAVANNLIQATQAAALLGTECVLVGIAPSIARTLVQIGIDFGTMTTRRDLQAGVAYALEQREESDSDEDVD